MRKYNLTKEQAIFIKWLRVHQDHTWRAVAREFTEKYPELEYPTDNQIVGRDLCEEAMVLLDEVVNQGWN